MYSWLSNEISLFFLNDVHTFLISIHSYDNFSWFFLNTGNNIAQIWGLLLAHSTIFLQFTMSCCMLSERNWRGWPQQWWIVCLTLKSTLKGWIAQRKKIFSLELHTNYLGFACWNNRHKGQGKLCKKAKSMPLKFSL